MAVSPHGLMSAIDYTTANNISLWTNPIDNAGEVSTKSTYLQVANPVGSSKLHAMVEIFKSGVLMAKFSSKVEVQLQPLLQLIPVANAVPIVGYAKDTVIGDNGYCVEVDAPWLYSVVVSISGKASSEFKLKRFDTGRGSADLFSCLSNGLCEFSGVLGIESTGGGGDF